MSDEDFVHLHTHTEYSNFDGCGKLSDFLKRAYEQGSKSIAFTEHGTLRQLTNLHKLVGEMADDGKPIRPIYGCELYLCDDMNRKGATAEELAPVLVDVPGRERKQKTYEYERDQGIIGRFHLTVLAKDQVGLRNLQKVVSLGWVKGFYKRPRVDLDCLIRHREGLLVMSGCQSGSIGGDFLPDGNKPANPAAALLKVDRLHEAFGEDFYGEIMPHNMAEQAAVNRAVRMISDNYGMKLVATQDAHYIDPEDWKYQEAMLCINTRTVLSNPDRFKFSTQDYWLKGRRDLEDSFNAWHSYLPTERVKEALDTTVEVAEKCQARVETDRFKALVPPIDIPPEFGTGPESEVSYIRHLCEIGWKARDLEGMIKDEARRRRKTLTEMRDIYRKRMERELDAMERQKVIRYFLVVWDLYKWVRAERIEVGPGRGSVGGSIVAFLLSITDIDPIRFDLLFERFLAPSRVDMPDVDMDFEDKRREEVIERLRQRYGEDCTAQIATNTKLTGKQCLKDIARIMDIPIAEIQPVVDAIITRSSGDERVSQTIEDSFEEFEICRKFNAKYPQVLEYAKKIEGQVKGLGMHAAGVVVAPEPLIEIVPLEVRNPDSKDEGERKVVTAVDMYGVGDLGLMKLDVLGIRNLSAMRLCREAILARKGIDIDWLKIPLDDKPTLDNFTKHNYAAIFQFNTTSADKISEGVEFTSFEDVAAMIALDRPGTARSGLATEYLARKKDPRKIVSIHPVVDEICKDTLGVIVYQEHVQRMFTDVAGFPPATADSLRRKIAKKYGDEAIAKERTQFVEGAVERGMERALAEKLIEQIKFFGSYGFNKAHSVAYGMVGYREMWLKTHYPVEFMWAVLAVEEETKEIVKLVRWTRKMGIEVHPPSINSADPTQWTIEGDAIVGALNKIKGCGQAACAAIAATRPFRDFVDFCTRIERRKVHKGVVESLIKAGAFGDMIPNRKWFVENLETLWGLVGKTNWQAMMYAALRKSKTEPDWDDVERNIIEGQVNPLASGADPLDAHVELIESMRENWLPLDAEDLFDRGHTGWIWGRVIELKYNQVGDFHSGPEPDADKKERMGWGKRYANLNVEDRSGRNQRVKVDIDIFEQFRHIIDKGEGVIIACHVAMNKQYRSMRASFVVDLDELHLKLEAGGELTRLELALWSGWTPGDGKRVALVKGDRVKVRALVARVSVKRDKKDKEMAFITTICADGIDRELICFASSWPAFADRLQQGVIGEFTVTKDKKSYILDDEIQNSLVVIE